MASRSAVGRSIRYGWADSGIDGVLTAATGEVAGLYASGPLWAEGSVVGGVGGMWQFEVAAVVDERIVAAVVVAPEPGGRVSGMVADGGGVGTV